MEMKVTLEEGCVGNVPRNSSKKIMLLYIYLAFLTIFKPSSIDFYVNKVKGWAKYQLFLRQWPSKDFGNFIDHYGAFTKEGITKDMYQVLAKSLFDPYNTEAKNSSSVSTGSQETSGKSRHISRVRS